MRLTVIFLIPALLISVITVSGCSLATPESVYIFDISLTDDQNQILVDISDKNYQRWELIYDIERASFNENSDNITEVIVEPTTTKIDYISTVTSNETGIYWELEDSNLVPQFNLNLNLNSSSVINFTSEPIFFVSQSLNTAYLILPYDFYQPEGPRDTTVFSTIVIVPLDGSKINYSFVAHSYLTNDFLLDSGRIEILDDQNIFFIYGNGADCVNSIYFQYDETSFEFLTQSFAQQRDLLDPRTDMLIVSSYQWESQISEIQVIDLATGNVTLTKITHLEIMELLGIEKNPSTSISSSDTSLTESASVTLPFLSFISSMTIIFILGVVLKKAKK